MCLWWKFVQLLSALPRDGDHLTARRGTHFHCHWTKCRNPAMGPYKYPLPPPLNTTPICSPPRRYTFQNPSGSRTLTTLRSKQSFNEGVQRRRCNSSVTVRISVTACWPDSAVRLICEAAVAMYDDINAPAFDI